jgi:hypothetical protein
MFTLAKLKAYAALAMVLLLVATAIIGLIYRAGYKSNEIDTLKDTVKAHETSDRISTDVDAMGLVARCLELGGLPDRCNELRGLDQAAPRQ